MKLAVAIGVGVALLSSGAYQRKVHWLTPSLGAVFGPVPTERAQWKSNVHPTRSLIAGRQSEQKLADGPGKAVVERVCGECHDAAEKITKLTKSEKEWAEVITDMEGRGMTASEKDVEVVLAYLTKNYGPAFVVAISH